ncbi:MAG TPA: hypothetical protein ENN28_02410 [Candidatus Uhrbacteria bacterium]|mgnify:CR=1 FL=1|nr:hypothetical protein [Candidatus Uhrbacteria bacterium]
MQLIKKNKPIIILSILAVIFFFIYSFLIFGNSAAKFTWPDETANYFFIQNYIEHSTFKASEPLNNIAAGIIKPRSFNVYQGNLVPGSFLGLLLVYGVIGKIFGLALVKFLTPLLAVLAGLFFYKILLKIFRPNIAFLSAILFFINPAWWYYANFAFLPNIAFLSFLIIGIYFLLEIGKDSKRNNYLFIGLGAFFIGLALTIRTNEFLWVFGILLLLSLVYHKKVRWQYVFLFLAVCFLVFLPVFCCNQATYGDYLSFGYLRLEQGEDLIGQLPAEFQASSSKFFNFIKFLALPFGLHPNFIINNFYNYYLSLFWWLFTPAVLGIFCLIKNYQKKEKAILFLIFLGTSLYLFVYYGSWQFEDHFTLFLNKMGTSYVRYFLPVYILSLPFAAVFYASLVKWLKNKKAGILLSLFLILSFIYFSVNLVYLSGNDNLIKVKQTIRDYAIISQKVIDLTEENAIIISERSDKIFFPERKVIGRWYFDDLDYWLNLLYAGVPLYYYAYEDDDYMEELNEEAYYYGFEFADKIGITAKEKLYKIKILDYENFYYDYDYEYDEAYDYYDYYEIY